MINVLIVSDGDYLPRAEVLVQCLAIHHPQIQIFAHLINVSEAKKAALLAYNTKVAIFKHEQIEFACAEDKAAYCANIRAISCAELLAETNCPLLYMDVDSIVRSPMDTLIEQVLNHDLSVHFRPQAPSHMKVASGVVGINTTHKGLELAQTWSRLMKEADNINRWFADQRTLHVAIEGLDGLNATHIEKAFIDWDFAPDSVIWVGKGPRKFSDLYLAEEAKVATRA